MSTTSTSAQVPKLRFPGFEDPWQRKPLGAVGEFKNGLNKGKEDFGFGHPFVNLMDVFGRSTLSSASFGLVNATDADLQAYDLIAGDVLFIRSSVKREGVGEAILVAEDLLNTVYSGFLIRFREYGSTLAPGFKRHGFGVPQFRQQVLSLATTSANTNINQDSLEQIEVSYPTKAEQQKIAAFLTAVDGRIEQLSRKKALLEATMKGVMQQLFTQTLRFQDEDGHDFPDWKEVELGSIADIKLGKMLDKAKHTSGRLLPYLNNISLRWNDVDTSNLPQMYFDDDELDRFGLKAGDVVVCEGGEPGRSAVWDGHLPDLKFQKAIHRVRFNVPFEPKILVLYLEYIAGTTQFEMLFTGGGIKHLTRETFFQLKVPMISPPEQTKIAGFLSALDVKIAAVGEQMRQTRAWKKGLLQQMFV